MKRINRRKLRDFFSNKKKMFYLSAMLMVLFAIVVSTSFAIITKRLEASPVTLKVGDLEYTLESDKLTDNQITLSPNISEVLDLKLTSLNSIDSKYELFYKVISPSELTNEIEIGTLKDAKTSFSGSIGAKDEKNIQIVINNIGNQEVVIEIGVRAGLVNNTLALESSEIAMTKDLYQKYFVYDYTGDFQTFVVPVTGLYEVQLWGASGQEPNRGSGGYVSGNISLSLNEKFFVVIGSQPTSTTVGGYNGGGISGTYNDVNGGAGGGATDIRLANGLVSSFNSLKSRIMVAGGAGGYGGNVQSGHAGGLIGYGSYGETYEAYTSYGGTQTAGGAAAVAYPNTTASTAGAFGIGGNGGRSSEYGYGGGGGGGYYGGGGGSGAQRGSWGGGGGSSFISGHAGCDAISESSTSENIVHTGASSHYSGYVFNDTVMIDGMGYNWTTTKGSLTSMPTYDLTSTMTGNEGNGYARITLVEAYDYEIESDALDGSFLALEPNSNKDFDVVITNTSAKSYSYELYYEVVLPESTSNTVEGGHVSGVENLTVGTLDSKESNTVNLTINNTGDETVIVRIGLKTAESSSDIKLSDNEVSFNKEIVLQDS